MKRENYLISLRKAKKVFPEKYTKVRREDMISLTTSKDLNNKEKTNVERAIVELENRKQFESIAVRKRNKIEFVKI